MPGVLAPELAARMELKSIAGVVGAVEDKSVLTAETELIASTCFCERNLRRPPALASGSSILGA